METLAATYVSVIPDGLKNQIIVFCKELRLQDRNRVHLTKST